MKLSALTQATHLAHERRQLVMLLEAIEDGHDVETVIGGWHAPLPEHLIEATVAAAQAQAEADLAEVERRLVALGVEIDVERERYVSDDDPDPDEFDVDDGAGVQTAEAST